MIKNQRKGSLIVDESRKIAVGGIDELETSIRELLGEISTKARSIAKKAYVETGDGGIGYVVSALVASGEDEYGVPSYTLNIGIKPHPDYLKMMRGIE
jgi:hypothetical protein